MIKKIARICALWLALIALVFIYTDKNEYTWQFSGEELAQVLLSPDQANAHIKTLQLAMDQEKEAARQRTEQGIWGRPNQYNGAPQTRPAVDDALGLNLMWGEYDVTVDYSASGSAFLETLSALRQSFIRDSRFSLTAGDHTNTFSFTLSDSAEQIFFSCDPSVQIHSITVHKSGAGVFSADLAAYALLAGGVLTWLMILSFDESERGKLRRRDAMIIVMTALFASMPLLWRGLYNGHDLFFHLNRIEGIASGLRAGQFPVAIHTSTLLGYGYAAPQFYPEIFLYIPAIMRNLGVSLSTSVRVFEMLIHLAAAIVCYLSARAVLGSRRMGLGAMVLYTLCSYRISNMYVRATLGESLAMIFFPLLCWALYEVLLRDEKNWPLLSIAMAGIMLSHLLSTLFAAGICLFCALVCAKRLIHEPRRILACVKAAIVMLLCSACFLVPFADYLDAGINTSVALMSSDHVMQPGALFVGFPGSAENLPYEAQDFAYTVGVVPGLVIVLGCMLLLIRLYVQGKEKQQQDNLFIFLLILGGILLLISTDAFPWAWLCRLPRRYSAFFQQIQYPWRLVGVACTPLSFCAAYGFMKDDAHRTQALCLIAALCAVLAGYSMQAVVQAVPLLGKEDFCDTRIKQYEYTYEGTEKSALVPGEIVALDSPEYEITEFYKQGTNLSFVLDAPQGFSSVELPLLYYPGYRAESNGESLRAVRGNNNQVRLYGITALSDAHVSVWFESPISWTIAAGVSAAGWIGLAALLLIRRKRA